MSRTLEVLAVGATLIASAAAPLLAQRGIMPGVDSVAKMIQASGTGYTFHIVDQDLGAVLGALAAKGGFSVILDRIPAKTVSIETTDASPVSVMLTWVRREASDNGLTITGDTAGTTSLVITGPAPRLTPQQLAQQAIQNAVLSVHSYRLQHAKADTLAPRLQHLLEGPQSLIRVVAEETTNSLLVRSTDADWQMIRAFIGAIDAASAPKQGKPESPSSWR